jgi:hypothetical protein
MIDDGAALRATLGAADEREILQNEIPTRTQGAIHPADEVPKHTNMPESYRNRGDKTGSKPFIL